MVFSCQKQNPTEIVETEINNEIPEIAEEEFLMQLPISMENKSDEEIKDFFSTIDTEMIEKMQGSYKIAEYLKSINKFDTINKDGVEYYIDFDLTKILTTKELADFDLYEPNLIENRGCYYYQYSCQCKWGGFFCSNPPCFKVYRIVCYNPYSVRYSGFCSCCASWWNCVWV